MMQSGSSSSGPAPGRLPIFSQQAAAQKLPHYELYIIHPICGNDGVPVDSMYYIDQLPISREGIEDYFGTLFHYSLVLEISSLSSEQLDLIYSKARSRKAHLVTVRREPTIKLGNNRVEDAPDPVVCILETCELLLHGEMFRERVLSLISAFENRERQYNRAGAQAYSKQLTDAGDVCTAVELTAEGKLLHYMCASDVFTRHLSFEELRHSDTKWGLAKSNATWATRAAHQPSLFVAPSQRSVQGRPLPDHLKKLQPSASIFDWLKYYKNKCALGLPFGTPTTATQQTQNGSQLFKNTTVMDSNDIRQRHEHRPSPVNAWKDAGGEPPDPTKTLRPSSLFGGHIMSTAAQEASNTSGSIFDTYYPELFFGKHEAYPVETDPFKKVTGPSSSLFGPSAPAESTGTPSLFGPGQQERATSLFGHPSNSSQGERPTSLFGGPPNPGQGQQPPSLFGNMPTSGPQGRPTSLFGGQQGQTPSLFGRPPNPEQPTSLFGGPLNLGQQERPTSLFGGPTNSGQGERPTSLFGGVLNSGQQGQTSSLFGRPSPLGQQERPPSLFGHVRNPGQQGPTSSLFGQPQYAGQQGKTSPLFGHVQTPGQQGQTSSLFGGPSPLFSVPTNPFANPNPPPNKDLLHPPSSLFRPSHPPPSSTNQHPQPLFPPSSSATPAPRTSGPFTGEDWLQWNKQQPLPKPKHRPDRARRQPTDTPQRDFLCEPLYDANYGERTFYFSPHRPASTNAAAAAGPSRGAPVDPEELRTRLGVIGGEKRVLVRKKGVFEMLKEEEEKAGGRCGKEVMRRFMEDEEDKEGDEEEGASEDDVD